MTELTDYIKSKREGLSPSSLKTYTSILKSLYGKVFGDEKINVKRFDETDKVISYLKDLEPNKRKTILSALVVITNKSAYRDLMLEDIQKYKTEINKQEKTDEQKENWVDGDELNKTFEAYKKETDVLYKKTNLKTADLQEIQNYIILCVLSGKFIAPRRSMDYVNMRIKGDIDKDKDNYIDKNKFIFNSYKTAKVYGKQELSIPKPLQTILKKWISVNPTDYLLFDTNGNKLTNVKLNQRFNKIFGKKASVNQMRHSYLTEKYKPLMEEQKKMAEDMKEMGSSQAQSSTYVKLD